MKSWLAVNITFVLGFGLGRYHHAIEALFYALINRIDILQQVPCGPVC
jgi:hypothetical protein